MGEPLRNKRITKSKHLIRLSLFGYFREREFITECDRLGVAAYERLEDYLCLMQR
jgi:hypothetical protein